MPAGKHPATQRVPILTSMFPMHWGPGSMRSREELKGRRIAPGTIWRALGFAKPYKAMVVAFLVATVAGSSVGIIPGLLFKGLLDGIDKGTISRTHQGPLTVIALAAVGIAFGIAMLSLTARWFSSRVGEGLIYDLRVTLFDHVQRMPIAFFTRSQTGALISRLNNDVIGAQTAISVSLMYVLLGNSGFGAVDWRE